MTRDEHRDIIAFITAVVRQDDELVQPPLDVEADAIIRALFVRNPESAYRVTRLAMAQRDQLVQLEVELAELQAYQNRSWLARLLKKRQRQQRSHPLDPDLSLFPQNVRSR